MTIPSIVSLALMLTVFLNLRRGLELSDTGYYYNTLTYFDIIQSLSTQYFLFWKLLPVPDGLYAARVTVFFLLLSSGMVFGYGLFRILRLPREGWFSTAAFVMPVTGCMFVFYYWWIPDPSYNSLGLIEMLAVSGLVLLIIDRVSSGAPLNTTLILSFAAGFSLAAFSVARPASAVLLLLASLCLYLLLIRKPLSATSVKLLLAGISGGLLFFALAHVFVEPLDQSLQRQLAGLEGRTFRHKNRNFALDIRRYFAALEKGFVHYFPWDGLAMAGGILASLRLQKIGRWRLVFRLVFSVGILGMLAVFAAKFFPDGHITKWEMSFYLAVLSWTLAIVMIGITVLQPDDAGRRDWRFIAVMLFVLLLSFMFVVGTSNHWLLQSNWFSGFSIAMGLACLAGDKLTGNRIWSLPVYLAYLAFIVSAFAFFIQTPYRLARPLAQQTIPVKIRGGEGGTLLVDPPTARFLGETGTLREQLGEEDNRAHLIDLSGKLPFLHYHLDARPLSVAWLGSTRKKSQAYFKFLLKRIPADDIKRAWISEMPALKKKLDPKALLDYGISFPQDYELVLETRSPYLKNPVKFYKPKTGQHKGAKP